MAWQLILAPNIVPICESVGLPLQMTLLENGSKPPSDELITFRASQALAQWDVTTLPERYIN